MIRIDAQSSIKAILNQPPKAPDNPPCEPIVIKIPPHQIRLPEQEPPKPPDEPEIDVPDPWDQFPPPEMPPAPWPGARVAISEAVVYSTSVAET